MTKEQYEREKRGIQDYIEALEEKKNALDREYVRSLTGIEVGDVIKYNGMGIKYGIVEDASISVGTPVFSVRLLKKDRTPSNSHTKVFGFQNPKKVEVMP